MQFTKYNSIENAYRSEFIEKVSNSGYHGEQFVVQEKVHGANLSYWTDGKEIKAAKRSDFLEETENFYNFQAIRDKYREGILQAFQIIKNKYSDTKYIAIFGELMGGDYRHDKVEKVKNAIKVQKGIYYTPENDFYAFDIRINGDNYLDIEEANSIFEKVGLFYARTLFKGNLEDTVAYPNDFESKIGQWLGYPIVKNNIAEGTVIKPVQARFLPSGTRVVIKNKNERWAENKKHHIKMKKQEEPSEAVKKLTAIVETYITENRLNNVISKIGEVSFSDFSKVLGLLNKDILEDFIKDNGSPFEALEKAEQKQIKKRMGAVSAKLLRTYMKKI